MTPRTRRLAGAATTAAALVVGAVFLAAVARHNRYGNSDNANALLAGRAMVTNPLLSGWDLPHDSYWLIDLPLFGLGSVLVGVRDGLLSAVPAVIDAALIGAGAAVAGLVPGPGRRRWWAGAAVVAILLGLPHSFLAAFLLQSPHHVATCLFCLVAVALLAGGRLGGWRWAAGTGLLAVSVQSDPIALAVGVAPVAAAGVVDALRRRRPAALAAPLAAAAGAVAGALLIGGLLRLAGGYRSLPDPPAIGDWGENLRAVPRILGGLLGASGEGGLHGRARAAHAAGTALFGIGIAATALSSLVGILRPTSPGPTRPGPAPAGDGTVPGDGGGSGPLRPPAGGWRERFDAPGAGFLDDALLVGCAGGVAVFAAFTDPPLQVPNARYLLPTVVFGAVLAARRTVGVATRIPVPVLVAGGAVLAAGYLTAPLSIVQRPVPTNPSEALAGWLEARGLRQGYGQYWVAAVTTVSAGQAVAVRPVFNDRGLLRPYEHFASRRWFGTGPFRFVVVDRSFPEAVDEPAAVRTFGAPAETHDVGRYRVLVWDRDLPPPPAS